MTETGLTEAEVVEAFRELVEASRALDPGRYFAAIDQERFTGLSADGTTWHSFQALEQLISNGFQMIDEIVDLAFARVKVTVINPSTAILVNEFRQTIRLKNGELVRQAGGETQVWSKSGKTWKLVSISASDASHRADAVF
ncbi:nuclear transport factor 2 family protein [Massilia oculi]|uniref:Nuclear transport factor 2 family protein n=1 Tax=Massilia hydrophila TaxID=3044279 RepID=A0ABS7YA81_9BURK|nr:nuclear transport factor 2 family protein [Massilia oculi]MCA1856002.1 nuclear transport factor 2 family protein [Massilia oculi]